MICCWPWSLTEDAMATRMEMGATTIFKRMQSCSCDMQLRSILSTIQDRAVRRPLCDYVKVAKPQVHRHETTLSFKVINQINLVLQLASTRSLPSHSHIPSLQLRPMNQRLIPSLIPSLSMNSLQILVGDRLIRVIPLGDLGRDFD